MSERVITLSFHRLANHVGESIRRTHRFLRHMAGAIVALSIGIPIYIYFFPSEPNYVTQAILKVGFLPITPPSNLRGPGTIYQVDSDGLTTSLCEVSGERLKEFIHESPTETQVAQALRRASFAADADLEKDLKARVKGDFVESVNFSLEEVSVLEISIANLRTIAAELQKDSSCANSILDYLSKGQYICQGQQVLRATSKYSIQTKKAGEGSVSARELRDAVRATIDPKANESGSTVISGEGLYYGMRLVPLCMGLNGNLPHPPVTWFNRILNFLNL